MLSGLFCVQYRCTVRKTGLFAPHRGQQMAASACSYVVPYAEPGHLHRGEAGNWQVLCTVWPNYTQDRAICRVTCYANGMPCVRLGVAARRSCRLGVCGRLDGGLCEGMPCQAAADSSETSPSGAYHPGVQLMIRTEIRQRRTSHSGNPFLAAQ